MSSNVATMTPASLHNQRDGTTAGRRHRRTPGPASHTVDGPEQLPAGIEAGTVSGEWFIPLARIHITDTIELLGELNLSAGIVTSVANEPDTRGALRAATWLVGNPGSISDGWERIAAASTNGAAPEMWRSRWYEPFRGLVIAHDAGHLALIADRQGLIVASVVPTSLTGDKITATEHAATDKCWHSSETARTSIDRLFADYEAGTVREALWDDRSPVPVGYTT